MYRTQTVLDGAAYQPWATESLESAGMGSLLSNEALSELVRALQGMAWIQVAGNGLVWAGDLISFYIKIKDGLKDQEPNINMTFAQFGAGGGDTGS